MFIDIKDNKQDNGSKINQSILEKLNKKSKSMPNKPLKDKPLLLYLPTEVHEGSFGFTS
jgi:hypothetical protein